MADWEDDRGKKAKSLTALCKDPQALQQRLAADALLRRAIGAKAINPELLRAALEQGACPDRPVHGTPPLHHAVRQKSPRAFFLLLRHGANFEDTDDAGNTAFDEALRAGWRSVIRFFKGRDAERNNYHETGADELRGHTAASTYRRRANNVLFEMIRKGDAAAVQAALDLGADPNAEDAGATPRYSPLHHAVASGDRAKVDVLIAAGGDIHAKSQEGESLLDMLWWAKDEKFFTPEWLALAKHLRERGCGDLFARAPEEMSVGDMRREVPAGARRKMSIMHLLARAGKFDVVLDRLARNPDEFLTVDDFVRQNETHSSMITTLALKKELHKVFTAAVWQGRVADMARVWMDVKRYASLHPQVDFEKAKQSLMDYRQRELRRRAQGGKFKFGKD